MTDGIKYMGESWTGVGRQIIILQSRDDGICVFVGRGFAPKITGK